MANKNFGVQTGLTIGPLTIDQATGSINTTGPIEFNGYDFAVGTYSSTLTGIRSLVFGSGSLSVASDFTVSGSNFTTSGSGAINMTSGSAKTFTGGNFAYTCALNQGGAGQLNILGTNSFVDLTNTYGTSNIVLPASTVTTITGMNLLTPIGNVTTLTSSISGTPATINTLSTSNIARCNIKDLTVTRPKVNAFTQSGSPASVNNFNQGNCTGFLYIPPGATFQHF